MEGAMLKGLSCALREGGPLLFVIVTAGCGSPTSPLASSLEFAGSLESAALVDELPGATGSGHTVVSGELRTFSFTAQQSADGTARGEAHINNRSIDEMFQIDVDCLRVVDNIAIMSGVVTRHTDVTAVGLTGIFGVVDAGEGTHVASDKITQVFFFRPGRLTCRDIDPVDVGAFAVPIVSGNVQVH